MKNTLVSIMLLLAVTGTNLFWGQVGKTSVTGAEADELERRRLELWDLYPRLANSQFVVIGTVTAVDYVNIRFRPPSIDADIGGTVYVVQVEKTLCRQEDFQSQEHARQPRELGPSLYFFVPYMPFSPKKERMEVGERYLLFTVIPDDATQREWTGQFPLDPEKVYVRGEELSRGVIHLPKPANEGSQVKNPEFLDKVLQLRHAVQPTPVDEKVAALSKLIASNDPILHPAAEQAVRALGSRPR